MQEFMTYFREAPVKLMTYAGGAGGGTFGAFIADNSIIWVIISAVIGTTVAYWVGKLNAYLYKKIKDKGTPQTITRH